MALYMLILETARLVRPFAPDDLLAAHQLLDVEAWQTGSVEDHRGSRADPGDWTARFAVGTPTFRPVVYFVLTAASTALQLAPIRSSARKFGEPRVARRTARRCRCTSIHTGGSTRTRRPSS